MKIEKISYKKIFTIAPYVNETIGVEVQVDEKDNLDAAMLYAKTLVEGWQSEKTYSAEPSIVKTVQVEGNENEYAEVKATLIDMITKEESEAFLSQFPEYINVYELKQIIKQKPSVNDIRTGEANY